MEHQLFSILIWLTIILLNLPPISCFSNDSYTRCGAPFNCGKLTGIGFPFWGRDRPAECGYAALKLDCENGTAATIQINDVKYRVLELNQGEKILKIARDDLLQSLCQPQLANTTLDPRIFAYASSYVNLTFLYGCPPVHFPVPYPFECAVKGIKERSGYVEFGSQVSGTCHASVVVPVSYASLFNFKDLTALIAEGFEVRFAVDSGGCTDCQRSGGRCGYNDAGKKFVCFCSDGSAAESKTCSGGSAAAPGEPVGNQGPKAATVAPAVSEFYQTCGNTFSCGDTITGIGYPFRQQTDPTYCGHPNLVLSCDGRNNATTIDIMSTTYRVLKIDQATESMRIVREDLMEGPCPKEMVNTTLDYSIFDYAASYTNFTFLYGCPASNLPGLSLVSCGSSGYSSVYVFPGTQGPGNCNASVIVPVILGGGSVNTTSLNQVLQQGFEVRWKIGGKSCSDCTESKGRCGYDVVTNQTSCFCSDAPYVSDTCTTAPANGGNSDSARNIGLFIGGAVLAGVGLGWLFFYYRQKRKQRLQLLAAESTQTANKEASTPLSSKHPSTPPSTTKFTKSIPSYPSSNSDFGRDSSYFGVQVFSYSELEEATNNFDSSRELGDGGFGTVYYGVLSDGRVVAVKRLYENNFKRVEQFMNEVEILTQVRHVNLVALFGCTSKRSRELLLVYEYIPNGTVADHLHGKRAASGLLSWPVRLNIAIESAEALAYLHKRDIIHRDVKTNNILLDNDFHVKVADFGLSRLFPVDATHVSTAPQGTPGYVDPEYYQCYQLTEKSDVYSFGVVLIELISSLQAVDTNRHRHDINLANMAVNKIQNHTLHELVDSSLGFETNTTVRRMATLVAELAFRCLQQEKDMRPSMEEVLEGLRGIKNEDLNAHKVEIVDILVDDETGPLKSSIAPPSPDSVAANSSTPNSSA
ncbi:LEAF RUST 10 DISEASE-RESISTANCE LOCUS RECEPTOR-LIKE PROTEIN KINASE-like 1.4 [Salvia miltiorrhiza]|uniref:LEAF RUST 10 DISEASE-RESISTANCE LOCUS RECEPTOR-LIKE PROTEIN KINASE-like 1.4 n=1 Tax=Salvia miltiorrhiza TaxID=226208 RepID=UPI0025AC9061|nr:LEAF RUST 10 DISEASE-RESISTANCE LOCUS RECEPTOR-LIKE PROTEIN KINASE-like 1.4 [Salvia miltiorrhiza]